MDKVTDYAGEAVDRLATQLRGQPNIEQLVRVLAKQAQAIEDACWPILNESVDNAEGVQLDGLGRIVGQEREGRPDDVFRVWIKARVQLNRSSGTPEQILSIFAALLAGRGAQLQNVELFPAAFSLKVLGTALDLGKAEPTSLLAVLRAAKVGGVRALLEYQITPPAQTFSFAGGPGLGFGAGAFATAAE